MTAEQPSYLSAKQVEVLLAPIREHRVGRDGKGFSHVKAYELRAHLTRIFGFARWSEEVVEQECVFEEFGERGSKTVWTVCYRSLIRLTVRAPDGTLLAVYTEGATGDATNQPSRADAHDLALKTSASQAFKRCCMNLGDPFGLSLYRNGSVEPLVKVTLLAGLRGDRGAVNRGTGGDIQDAAPVTHRPPDPAPDEPADRQDEPPIADDPPPAEGANPPRKMAEDYRLDLLNAPDKAAVRAEMMALEVADLGEAQVGDINGEPTMLRNLAAAMMKALK